MVTIHSLYFLFYAAGITAAGLTMAAAMYANHKNEGKPINYKALVGVFLAALAMWTGAGVTEYAYNPNPITGGIVVAFAAVWVSLVIAWQVFAHSHNDHHDKPL